MIRLLLLRKLIIRDSTIHEIRVLMALVIGLLVVHVAAMMSLESMSFSDAAWFSLTTILTVGYGDITPKTDAGRLATIFLMYFPGIACAATLAGSYFEYREEVARKKRTGRWRWSKMRDHIVIIGDPGDGAERYFRRLAREIRSVPELGGRPIVLLTKLWKDGLPEKLNELGVVHYIGHGSAVADLDSVSVRSAAHIVILHSTDDEVFSVAERVSAVASVSPIVEVQEDENRDRISNFARCVLRPMRAYPAMIVRAMVAPGSEEILENLFTAEGDEIVMVPVEFNRTWGELVCALMMGGVGTAIAYRERFTDLVIDNPKPSEIVASEAIYIIADHPVTEAEVRNAIAAWSKS